MTIQFNCPTCNTVIAFPDKHIGKRARCLTCGQLFIIPSKDHEKPQKVELKIEKGPPVPGFYRAVFVDTWKLFTDKDNVTSLIFVIAVVCFHFFLAGGACCMGFISFIATWGWLLGFYLNIIYETAFDIDKLPEIYLGTSITFLWYIIQPFLVFFFTMIAVQAPFIAALILLQDKGLTCFNMWDGFSGLHLLLQGLFIFGLFIFPIAILTTAVGQSVTLLRPDYLLAPVLRAFMPYITIVALLTAAAVLEMHTSPYTVKGLAATSLDLSVNFAVQVLAIFAMRSIGLFYRHYSCHFHW
jgi:hypothetical protein